MDVRKKQRATGGLAPHPQVVAPGDTLPTCTDIRIPIVVPQLNGLVHPTSSITQVRRLRRAEVGAEALYPTLSLRGGGGEGVVSGKRDLKTKMRGPRTHKPIAFAKCKKPPSEIVHGELSPEMRTCSPQGKLVVSDRMTVCQTSRE